MRIYRPRCTAKLLALEGRLHRKIKFTAKPFWRACIRYYSCTFIHIHQFDNGIGNRTKKPCNRCLLLLNAYAKKELPVLYHYISFENKMVHLIIVARK